MAAAWTVVGAQLPRDRLVLGGRGAGDGGGLRRGALLELAQPEQDDRDVVLAAALVGGLDQGVGCVVERGRGTQDRGHLVVRDHRRQAVRAQQEQVALAGAQRVGVDLDVRLGTEGARDDRALRMVLRRLGSDLAAPLELRDQRVVAGDLLELAVAHAVGAAVADVAQAHLAVVDLGRRQRRAHAAARLVGHRQVVDAPVRLPQDAGELCLGCLARLARSLERPGGDRRRHLARARAAHAVGDREERRLQHE